MGNSCVACDSQVSATDQMNRSEESRLIITEVSVLLVQTKMVYDRFSLRVTGIFYICN